MPDLFRLPFGDVEAGTTIRLHCQYLEPLQYFKKGYSVCVPLYFPQGTIVENARFEKVVSITCKINALNPTTTVKHNIKIYIYMYLFIYCVVTQTKKTKKKKKKKKKKNSLIVIVI